MPGVLVDDQSFSLDAMSQAFLLDSLSSPASCGSPLSLPFQASSPSPAPAPCLHPCFTRALSHNSSDAELSRALSQLSPLLHHHRQAGPRVAGGLGRSSHTRGMEGLGTEDFLGEHFAGDQQGPSCDGSLAHRSGELVFGGLPAGISELQFAAGRHRAGNMYAGNELEEQDVGLPFSAGGSLWGGQTAGGGGGFLVGSPTLPDAVLALQKFLPSNLEDEEAWPAVDVYSCDEFRMFEFKVKRCMRGRSHDWTECPFSHPGEKARRRDPRRFHYSGTACPDFRKGNCKRGDACEFAHGVFECWLHPARYRTQPCKDERNCKRRVCFFAHTPEQLRLLPTAQAANGGSPRSSSSASPPLKSVLAQKLAQCAAAASYDGSPLRCSAMGAPFVDASQIIDAGSPPGFRDAVTVDGASPFARLGSFGTSNGSCRSTASLLSSGFLGSSLHHSPGSLSPPLSPSMSPPGSPDDWSSSLTKNLSCLATPGTTSSPLGQTGNLAQFAFSGQSVHPLQSQGGVPAHRRHLDRLNSALYLSIPADQGRAYSALSSPTSACPQSSNQIVDLSALLKQAELSGPEGSYWLQAQAAQTATMIAPKFSSGPSPLRRGFQSVPGTPTKMGWKSAEVDLWGLNERKAEPALERVESGRCLRATIFESLVKGNEQGSNDDPDVGWVNELVKEELH